MLKDALLRFLRSLVTARELRAGDVLRVDGVTVIVGDPDDVSTWRVA